MSAPGFMDRFGARLIANGYPIIPIQPGSKKPGCHRGGGWRDYPAFRSRALPGRNCALHMKFVGSTQGPILRWPHHALRMTTDVFDRAGPGRAKA